MSGRVRASRAGAVVTLLIDRPERANALTPELASDLAEQLRLSAGDSTVRCVVLRGAGGRAFCGGFDLGRVGEQHPTGLEELMAVLDASPVPTVAVLDGPAIGAGLELACRCDLRLARRGSLVGLPAVKLGVAYRTDGLAAILSATRGTTELMLTGEALPVDELPGMARCVPREDLDSVLAALTAQLSSTAPAASAYTLRAVRALARPALPEPLVAVLAEERAAVMRGGDLAEAVQARREGREPRFMERQTGQG